MGNTYTKAQAKASKKYVSNFSKITVLVTPELKETLVKHCKDNNTSMTAFVIDAIESKLKEQATQ